MNSNKKMTIPLTRISLSLVSTTHITHKIINLVGIITLGPATKASTITTFLNQIALLRELFSQLMALGSAFIQPEMSTIL